MTKIRMLLLFFVLAGCTAGAQGAQDGAAGGTGKSAAAAEPARLFVNVERAFREKEPARKFGRVRTDTDSDTRKQGIVLRTNVIVFAPSTPVAERFARRVLEQLNAG